ncbi:MAG: hypothetical protein ACE15C_15495 [Phycisphaerae bacterium]
MAHKRKSWREKLLDSKDLPKVVKIAGRMSRRWGVGTVAIPAPLDVDALMRKVPKGRLTTINEIRKAVAARHGATIGCPICCGIFSWVSAHAAAEDAAAGRKLMTPWWRTLKSEGQLNEKYPGGVEDQAKLLAAEGHTIARRGKKTVVVDYERKLAGL